VIKALGPDDIRDFLKRFATAIMRDQIYVDTLPQERFHHQYNGDMWFEWRLDHLAYLNTLLITLATITPRLLTQLTRIAITKKPATVQQMLLELFAECASRSCPREDVATAALFFDRLVRELSDKSGVIPTDRNARKFLFKWLEINDPLRISRDPECRYGIVGALTG
jgi:hypothetical protein